MSKLYDGCFSDFSSTLLRKDFRNLFMYNLFCESPIFLLEEAKSTGTDTATPQLTLSEIFKACSPKYFRVMFPPRLYPTIIILS